MKKLLSFNNLKRLTLIAIFFLSIQLQAYTQSNDIEYASALAQKGYFQDADYVCQKLLQEDPSEENKKAVGLVKAQMLKTKAQMLYRDNKLEDSLAVWTEAYNYVSDFAPDDPAQMTNQVAPILKQIAQLSKAFGNYIDEILKTVTDTEKIEEYRILSRQAYMKSRNYYKALADMLFQKLDKMKNENPQMESEMIMAKYMAISTLYSYSVNFPEGDPEREKNLKLCLKKIEDFLWDYETYLIAYEVRLVQAKCYNKLNRREDAIRETKNVINFKNDEDFKYDRSTKYYVTRGYQTLSEFYKEFAKTDPKYYKILVKEINDYYSFVKDYEKNGGKAFKGFSKERDVILLLIDKMIALMNIGQNAEAIELSKKIVELSPEFEPLINDKLKGAIDPKTAPISLLAGQASKALRDSNYDNVIKFVKQILARQNEMTDEEVNSILPDSLITLSKAYYFNNNYYGSIACLYMIYTRFPKSEYADLAVYKAARYFATSNTVYNNKFDEKKSTALLTKLIEDYPNSKYKDNGTFIKAEILQNLGKKDPNKYIEATDAYKKVSIEAEAYEDALSRIGYCYYLYAKKMWNIAYYENKGKIPEDKKKEIVKFFNDAKEAINNFVDYTNKNPIDQYDTENTNKRKSLLFSVKLSLAGLYLHDAIQEYEKIFVIFEDADEIYKEDGSMLSSIWVKEIEAYVRLKKLDKAESLLATLESKFAQNKNLPNSYLMLGLAYDEKLNKLDEKDRTNKKVFARKVGKYLGRYISLSRKFNKTLKLEQIAGIADKLFSLGTDLNDKEVLKSAVNLYSGIVAGIRPKQKINDMEKYQYEIKLGISLNAIGKSKTALPIFEQLYKDRPTDGTVMRQLITAYIEMGKKSGSPDNEYFNKAQEVTQDIIGKTKQGTENWWWAKVRLLVVLYEKGMYPTAKQMADFTRKLNPKLTGAADEDKEIWNEYEKKLMDK